MAQRRPHNTAQKRPVSPAAGGAAADSEAGLRLPLWAWAGGAVCLLAAAGSAGALVWQHFTGRSLPGCGPESGCASIENHPMGKVPIPDGLAELVGFAAWPASFLGFTFFAAMIALWLLSARTASVIVRAAVWVGIASSVAYLVAIVMKLAAGGDACKYCLASHAANFGVLVFLEAGIMSARRSGPARRLAPLGAVSALVSAAAVFAVATGALGYAERAKVGREAKASEAARAEAERAMLEQASAAKGQQGAAAPAWNFGPQGFTGRYREGPEQAVARIVIFSDYQCHQCKRIENEARALRAKYADRISISHKHYPWASACNKYLNGQTLHPNACWAARAAEAAALLKGNEGFWQMHRWLFDRGGGFTDQELNDGLVQLGYDPKVFIPVMTGEGTLRPVQQDIDEAQALGISGTPMVFINGIELKGWEAPRALERTVEAVLQSGAPAATSVNDRPVLAKEKYIADWRDEAVMPNVAGTPRRELKNGDASVEVVVFGDFLESNTAKLDAMLREWGTKPIGQGGKPIRYVFRHYPGDKTCNTRLPKTFFENGCLAARAVEAAALVGGEEGYWKMHAWIFANRAGFNLEAVRRGAAAAGLDADAVVSALERPEAQGAVGGDLAAAHALNVGQIPCVYVNGKFVKRWTREGDNVMERIIDEAASR